MQASRNNYVCRVKKEGKINNMLSQETVVVEEAPRPCGKSEKMLQQKKEQLMQQLQSGNPEEVEHAKK